MFDIIINILSKYGFIGLIISIVLYVMRSNPITFLSSTSFELKLLSKEKRAIYQFIHKLAKLLLLSTLLLSLTNVFINFGHLYNLYFSAIVLAILLMVQLLIVINNFREKKINDFVNLKELDDKKQFLLGMLLFLYITAWILLPSYFIGTQISEEHLNLDIMGKFIINLLLWFCYLFLSYTVFYPVYKDLLIFFKGTDNSQIILYIEMDNQNWYIFYPTTHNTFFLGNNKDLNKCTEVKFVKKDVLMEYIIKVNSPGQIPS